MPKHPRPPRLGRMMLRLARLGRRRLECDSDLSELFAVRLRERGAAYAQRRYLRDALSLLWRPSIQSMTPISGGMSRLPAPRLWRLDPMPNDIRFAFRLFRRQAGVMTLAVVGLALAIGVNTAAFSFINASVLRPLGVPHPELAVSLSPTLAGGVSRNLDYAEFVRFRERAHLLKAEVWVPEGVTLTEPGRASDAGGATPAPVRIVSGGFFDTFGGQAAFGRVLQPADDVATASPIAVISHTFWRSRFGADPAVIGRTVLLTGTPVTIVGVVDRRFTGPFTDAPALWLPLGSANAVFWYLGPFHPASRTNVNVIARLSAAGTFEAARAEAAIVLQGIAAESPMPSRPVTGARLEPASRQLSPNAVAMISLLMAIVGLVLLLACANIANLLLSGAAARQKEIGARLALGASRGRIARQLMTESLLLGLMGGALGLIAATWMLPALARLVPLPAGTDVSPDWRVYTFAALASVVAGVAAGLAPARYGARGNLLTALKGAGTRPDAGPRQRRLRSTFVGIQAAASMLLLVLAALFGRAVLHAATMNLGFDPARFLSAQPRLGRTDPHGVRAAAFFDRAVDRARSLPGVEAASIALMPPFSSAYMPVTIQRDGRRLVAHENRTSADYFRTIGLELVRGRLYTDDEVHRSAPVAVISSRLARDLGSAVDPIGRPLSEVMGPPMPGIPDLAGTRVIGIVTDVVSSRLREPDVSMIYLPLLAEDTRGAAQLLIRTSGDAGATARPIEQAVGALDPEMRMYWSLAIDGFNRELDPARIVATLTGILGTLALSLAVIGLFGVNAVVVSQRLTEVGIRMALGATGRDVLGLLLRDSLRPVVVGLTVGLAVAFLGGQFLASVLYGISPRDPMAMSAAVGVLVSAAAVAVLIPARRAARVDPARVLRQS